MPTWATKKDMRYGLFQDREETVSKFIPYTRHITPSTLQTKENHYIKIIKLKGLPFETADSEEIEHRQNIRATLLRGIANNRFAIYHHIIRKHYHPTFDDQFENSWCHDLNEAYKNRLSKKQMFINEQYISVIRRPAKDPFSILAEIGRSFSDRIDKDIEKDRRADALNELDEITANLISTLSSYGPELLGIQETPDGLTSTALSFLSYLINNETGSPLLPLGSVAEYLPAKRISFGKETFEIGACR